MIYLILFIIAVITLITAVFLVIIDRVYIDKYNTKILLGLRIVSYILSILAFIFLLLRIFNN